MPEEVIPNNMVANDGYVAARWRKFYDGCGLMRLRVCKAEADGHAISKSPIDATVNWCPTWNIQGVVQRALR